MFKLLWRFLQDQRGTSLSITRKTSNTLITASGFNTNFTEIEAIVNALTADNLGVDCVTAVKLNADVVRSDYGLKQHTDGSLFVDVSDTNPGLEISDGGLRVKEYGLLQRGADGLEWGRTGEVAFSTHDDTPDGFSDVSATYAGKYLRIGATALATGGSATHTHTGTTDSHTLTIAEMPAHTHTAQSTTAGTGFSAGDGSAGGVSGSTGGGGGHTHTIASADNNPLYVDLKMLLKN